MKKSNPNLQIGQKVKFDRVASLPDKPDMKQCRYGTIVGVQFDEDDGVSYLVKEDYKRTRNTTDIEHLKFVRGPLTLHESEVQPDDIYVGKRMVANWPEKKYSCTVRIYWWYNNHVLVGPDDVVTDKPQNYQIVDRSQLEDHNLVSSPPDLFLHARIIYAFELMCQYGLAESEKLEDVVEIVKACGHNGARRAIKQYATNKGYGATHTLAEAVRTEQWESSKKHGEPVTETHTTEVPNTSAESVKRSGDLECEATKLRIEEIAKIIGTHPDVIKNCDQVTVVGDGVIKTMTLEEFVKDFDKLSGIQSASSPKGDTTPEETHVNCGGPLVSASVVKEKDALIALLKKAIEEKDRRLCNQGDKIRQADSRAKYWEAKFNRLARTIQNAIK